MQPLLKHWYDTKHRSVQQQEVSGAIHVEDKPDANLRMSMRAMAVCCCVKLLLAPLAAADCSEKLNPGCCKVCTVGTLVVLKSGLLVDSSTV